MRVRAHALVGTVILAGLTATSALPAAAATQGGGQPSGKQRAASDLRAHSAGHGKRAPQGAAPQQQVLVVHGSAAQLSAAESIATSHHGRTRHRLPSLHALSLSVPVTDAAATAYALQARGLTVTRAVTRHFAAVPDDVQYPHQAVYLSAVKAPAAWDVTHGSASVKVAIVDSGVDTTNPDLAGKVVGSYNALDGTTDVTDTVGHGTFVAGVAAAATNNTAGVAGAGYDTSILAVKVADVNGNATVDNVAAGIVWAAQHGAKVINLSLGGPDTSSLEQGAIAQAQQLGAVVVAAAGNDGSTTKSYPAADPGVIAVGATTTDGSQRVAFSNYGPWVTVAAPGESIYSTTPHNGSDFFPAGDYSSGDGTSFSSPLVAGEVALLAGAVPGASADQLKAAVTGSAHALTGSGLGAGIVDFAGALTLLPPATVPSITSPAPAAVLSAAQDVVVSSTASSVQLYVDGKPVGSPVGVSNGTATAPLSTWGFVNGSHTLGAADCNSHGCGGLGTVDVSFSNTAPSITGPADASTVHGTLPVTATSGAPAVRFSVDGTSIGLSTVTSGTATGSWETAGLANGTHTLSAAACNLDGSCGDATSVSVTVADAAPVITSPKAGQLVSSTTTFTSTDPDAGGIAYSVDGNRIGFSGTGARSLAFDTGKLTDGTHTIAAQLCDHTGALCNGPVSSSVSFTVKSLHPVIAGVTSPFSPNGDKVLDTSRVVLRLPDTESVSWRVTTLTGAVVFGPRGLGTLAKGDHAYVWNGLNNAGRHIANGTYNVLFTTSATVSGAALRGTVSRSVVVDTVAPGLSGVVGSGATFYPVRDGYHDTQALSITSNEASAQSLRILNPAGSLVRALSRSTSGAGAAPLTWDGKTSSGAIATAGTYHFLWVVRDRAGNTRTTGRYNLYVSGKRLVAKSTALLLNGNQAYSAGGSAACADADTSLSEYPAGLWLDNACDPYYDGDQIAAALYHWTLPSAIKYTGLAFDAYGFSLFAPSTLEGAAYNYVTDEYDGFAPQQVGSTPAWHRIVSPSAASHISGRSVDTGIDVVDDASGSADFDIKQVRLTVNYQVLA